MKFAYAFLLPFTDPPDLRLQQNAPVFKATASKHKKL